MIKRIIFFLVLSQFTAMAQDSFTIVDKLRKFELEIEPELYHGFDEFTREMIDWRLSFLKVYDSEDALFVKMNSITLDQHTNLLGKFLFYINKGDYVFNTYHNKNVEVRENYLGALRLAEDHQNNYLICEALKRLLFLNRQTYLRDNLTAETYLKAYEKIAYDDLENSYYNYFRLILDFQYFKLNGWDDNISSRLLEFAKGNKQQNLNALIYQLHGSYYHAIKDNEKAIDYEERAIQELNKIPYAYKTTLLKNSHFALTRYQIYNNDPLNASRSLEKTQTKAKNRIETINNRYYYYYKSMLDSISGDYTSAYSNLGEFNEKSVFYNIQKNQNAFNELETKYQTAEKEKQILIEKQQKEENKNIALALGGVLLFGGLIFYLVQNNTSKKRKLAEQEALIEQQKVQTLLKEQELVSLDAMIAGQEKERTKVANELHDDLGSLMATVKLHFDNVKVDEKDPAMKSAQDLLEKAYQKIRGMAHAKNSGVMANQGLLPAVQKMARTINETKALEVTVEDFGLADRMENSLELTIFRMLQELVTNIIKHAQATKASIQFTQHEDKLNIIVEDNGKGFDMSATKRSSSGMGLGSIEKRIEHLEGSFTVDSVLGKGTSILIDIPL